MLGDTIISEHAQDKTIKVGHVVAQITAVRVSKQQGEGTQHQADLAELKEREMSPGKPGSWSSHDKVLEKKA